MTSQTILTYQLTEFRPDRQTCRIKGSSGEDWCSTGPNEWQFEEYPRSSRR